MINLWQLNARYLGFGKLSLLQYISVGSGAFRPLAPISVFCQVVGFPIYGTGQPTEAGFSKLLEK